MVYNYNNMRTICNPAMLNDNARASLNDNFAPIKTTKKSPPLRIKVLMRQAARSVRAWLSS